MAEWFKAHAWNACWAQALAGSNPVLSAKKIYFLKKSLTFQKISVKIVK